MKENDIIEVEINGVLTKAEVASILERKDERFVVYIVSSNNESKLYASKLIDNDGTYILEDINDLEIHEYILKLVSSKVKAISNASINNLKESYEESSKKEEVKSVSSLIGTRVNENNIGYTIDIMKEWSEENK